MSDSARSRPSPSVPGSASPRTSALLVVLDEGKELLERTAARVGQAAAVLGLAVAGYVAVVISPRLGGATVLISALALAWFTLVVKLSRRPRLARQLSFVTPFIEVSIPSLVLIALATLKGPVYAAASWVPPQLYTVVVLLSLLRLRPAIPVLMGLVGAAEYLLVATLFLGDAAPPDGDAEADMQTVRALALVFAGGLGSLVVLAVRRGLDRVANKARSKDLFGKYRLGEVIASGGMGTVVKATYCPEGGFERPVAIKRIHAHLAQDGRFVKGFREEAELSARLGHPNIVTVLDFGGVDDTYFFAMEYVDGLNLRQLLDRAQERGRPLPQAVAVWIAREVAEGLHFAHVVATDGEGRRLRVVHRDLSPTNVLVSFGGEVKVSDFGIARVLRDATGHHTDHLTGKVAYMAPEQAVGEKFDERADLFSLGLILREMLTAAPLFARATQAATLLAVLKDPVPPLKDDRPEIDDELARIVDKALEREPTARWSSARELADALGGWLDRWGTPSAEDRQAFLSHFREADPGDDDLPPELDTLPTNMV